jgi:alkanesulfonate monooxygenase SsuD/methylene tetrahydromethanopterin reductase-like flavin-dependent oxidoreductase (luciferase family)
VQQAFTNIFRRSPGRLQPPIDDIEQYWTPPEKHQASHMLEYSIVGSPETVSRGLERIVALTKADELMVVSSLFDHAARLRSYEIVAEIAQAR